MTPSSPLWRDRHQAGRELAQRFQDPPAAPGTVLLALPRGGVPVAAAMAAHLQLPLATWSVRKVADPAFPEVAVGAVAAGGVVVWRQGAEEGRRAWLQEQERELARRRQVFGDPEPGLLRGRPLIVVDDGIATGMTVQAALRSLRRLAPASLALAVPVVDRAVALRLSRQVERFEALAVVDDLVAVGLWFERFEQLSDAEVLELLAAAPPLPRQGRAQEC
ncbi:MAG: phosphoribosyltransferase [Prochlorococcaceae cyanobacterium]|jgi:putative phosphoribosyl transferase